MTLGAALPLIGQTSLSELGPFILCAGAIAIIMMVWDCIEVGRNDAANLVNAVFGARVLSAKGAVYVAAVGVVLGAVSSAPVMETARKGIFSPGMLTIEMALAVYVSVYIIDTVMLYGFSAFGMPVSTTACLVFELLGASLAIGLTELHDPNVVKWEKAGTVVAAIVCSIFISGIAAFLIQRAARGAVRDRTQNLGAMLAHGGWIGGGLLAGLTYFMLVKGMNHISWVEWINKEVVSAYGPTLVVLGLWGGYALLIHISLVLFGRKAAKHLFGVLAIIGTFAMAFAFGQNDLANCASPGLASLNLIYHASETTAAASKVPIPVWALGLCGVVIAMGMTTKNAQRVTSAAVHAGSMSHNVRLWAPTWCVSIARVLLKFRGHQPVLAPTPTTTQAGKMLHYDALRACVILGVSASVIAAASGFGLPVSTTYVSFAAIVATGMADRIFQRGDADLKLARTIWVVFSWFAGALLAAVATGFMCLLIYYSNGFGLGAAGMIVGIGINLFVRWYVKKKADVQEARVRQAARERLRPEMFAEASDDD